MNAANLNRVEPDGPHAAGCEVGEYGVAGGIGNEKAGVMEVVAASEVVYHDVWCGNGNEVRTNLKIILEAGFVVRRRRLTIWLKLSLDASVPCIIQG